MSYSNLKDNVYLYLGYKNKKYDESIDNIIDECLLEVEKLAQFKYSFSFLHLIWIFNVSLILCVNYILPGFTLVISQVSQRR